MKYLKTYNESIFSFLKKKNIKKEIPISEIKQSIKDYLIDLKDDGFIIKIDYSDLVGNRYINVCIETKYKDQYEDDLDLIDRAPDLGGINWDRIEEIRNKALFNIEQIKDSILSLKDYLKLEYNLDIEISKDIESNLNISELKLKILL